MIVISLKEEFYSKADALIGVYPEVRTSNGERRNVPWWFPDTSSQYRCGVWRYGLISAVDKYRLK